MMHWIILNHLKLQMVIIPLLKTDTEMHLGDFLFPAKNSEFSMMSQSASCNFEGNRDNLSFIGRNSLPPNANSDGYIPDGRIDLISTIGDVAKSFNSIQKTATVMFLTIGHHYRIDGSRTVAINGIKYDKI